MKDLHEESRQGLLHILQAIEQINQYVDGATIESFCKTALLHDAVMLQFVIIGEAIMHVQNGLLDKYAHGIK